MRIDYNPTTFGPGAITFARETRSAKSYCKKASEKEFRKMQRQVMKILKQMISDLGENELPDLLNEESEG